MSTHNALYVEAAAPQILAAVKSLFPSACATDQAAFVIVPLPVEADFHEVVRKAAGLSKTLETQVFHLLFQSAADSFRFEHFSGGRSLRCLQYGCEEQYRWERVSGDPEAWEIRAFFSDARQLEDLKGEPEYERAERIWRLQRVEEGSSFPFVDAREAAQAAATHYQLPGW